MVVGGGCGGWGGVLRAGDVVGDGAAVAGLLVGRARETDGEDAVEDKAE